ncbi:sensor domain-containing protein [Nonomuraea rubra]|uniref:sensor domain-containing protein n=1 Tax=Nonomuraea rubra TaxID=46180 RepID=UPI003623F840
MTTLRHRLATDTRYTLLGLPMAVVHFAVVVVGISAGLGTAVVFIGLPILAATAAAARNLADFERVALPGVLGRPVARPPYRPAPAWAGRLRRTMNPLTSGQAAIDLLYGILAFPVSLAASVVVAVWWAGTLAGLTFPCTAGSSPPSPAWTTACPSCSGWEAATRCSSSSTPRSACCSR